MKNITDVCTTQSELGRNKGWSPKASQTGKWEPEVFDWNGTGAGSQNTCVC